MDLATTVVLTALGSGLLTTAYMPVKEQTDDTPMYTSTNEHVTSQGMAVSQDLLWSGRACYGDWIYLEGVGFRRVNDAMNNRHRNRGDILVWTKTAERDFGTRQIRAYVWKSPERKCVMDTVMRMDFAL